MLKDGFDDLFHRKFLSIITDDSGMVKYIKESKS